MLKSKDFKLILSDIDIMSKMEPFIDALILSGVFMSFIGFIMTGLTSAFDEVYTLLNAGLFVSLTLVYIFKNRVPVQLKVAYMIFLLMISGTVSFHINGMFGVGSFLLLAGILMSVIFLKVKTALFITFLSSMKGIHFLTLLILETDSDQVVIYTESYILRSYLFVYIGILIVTISIFVAVAALKKFLLSSLETVNMQVKHMESQNKHLMEMNKEVEYLAYHNALTTLYNKAYFKTVVSDHLSKGMKGIMILADIKNFQNINAFYGTDFGDFVLKSVGMFLEKNYKDVCDVAYLGNNSFAFWVHDDVDFEKIVAHYTNNLKGIKTKELQDIELDFYIVAAVKMDFMKSYDDIYTVADKAMKLVKRNNQDVVFIDQKYLDEIRYYESYVAFLDKATQNDEFLVYYQEKVNTSTNKVIGVEALARVNRDGNLLMPTEFIPIIEDNNLAGPFGQMIMNKVFKDVPKIIEKYGKEIVISINVSPHQLSETNFISRVKKILEINNISAKNIVLEITENILLQDRKRSINILNELKRIGFTISIDDFGTGYSSMSYISELPVDIIKIDKTFIDKILLSRKTWSVVKSIIEIAHINDLLVIAEGVESIEQVEVLKKLNCFIVQGYLYSEPKQLS